MTSRRRHRASLLTDLDVLHVASVAALACVLSGGLLYLGYWLHVLRIARRSHSQPSSARCVLLFGKHAPGGRIDADFEARIARTAELWRQHAPDHLFLLGGGAADAPSEAEIARDALQRRVDLDASRLHLERESRDTLQNLRNARELLQQTGYDGPVTLVSSRYHLARCALFARQLGIPAQPCAAEPTLRWTPKLLWQLAGEAGYVCLVDIGTRWARLIGSRRMLARIS
ncbi:MAG: YdcF family protein [Pseudomonadota bacterium]|nr:YdcF family protein [Pseudomonadota bacterium]